MGRYGPVVALLLLVASLSACSPITTTRIYDGPELGPSEIAIVRGDRYLEVKKVDGKDGAFTAQVFRGEWTSQGFELHFLPGAHVFEVKYIGRLMRSVVPVPIRFVAERGKRYVVKYEIVRDAREWRVWLEEERGT